MNEVNQYFEKLPKTNNKSIKDIETITEIFSKSKGGQFEHHFYGENATESQVADFDHPSESVGLVMVLYAHAQSVHKNAHTNALQENVVFNHEF